jgi:hypothetical protein
MIEVIISVREVGCLKPDYSLVFALPALPRIGDYISIFRPDSETHSEDLIVRRVWWQLHHDETEGFGDGDDPLVGRVRDIMVECDQAIGPYARDHWRDGLERAAERGETVERFEVARFSVREDELRSIRDGEDRA